MKLNRVDIVSVFVCLGFVIGILFSLELWFPVTRSFPRISILVALPETLAPLAERVLSVILIISLALAALVRRTKAFSNAAITSLILLIFFDQMRLQPWVYHYLLLLSVVTLLDRRTDIEAASDHTLCLLQVVIASLYFWSGLQKLNFSFAYEILPELLLPLRSVLPTVDLPSGILGIFVASSETLIGLGLLFRRTRKISALFAVAIHLTILGSLIAKGYNSVVWAWNAALILIVTVAFWGSDASIWRTITSRHSGAWGVNTARSITLAAAGLPILSFLGWWDMYLSGALYSGNTPVAVVRINGNIYEKLPVKAQQQVFVTKGSGEQMLPLFEWAMADLNVPVYPERRVFTQVTREVCKLSDEKNHVEVIIKERPAMFDGRYHLTRIKCTHLAR